VAPTEWDTVQLGDVARLDIDRVAVKPDDAYRLAGVLIAGQGLFWRETIQGSDTNYAILHRLRTGQLVMRKLTAWEGPITTVPSEFDGGYVSSEFPTFTLDTSRLLPEYMRLICQRADFHAEMRMRSTGTAERRNRLKPDDLLSIEIDVPPLAVQARVAEIVSAADAVIDRYTEEGEAAEWLLAAARSRLLDGLDVWPVQELVRGIEAGKSPQALDRKRLPGEPGVLKVSSIRPGEFRPDEAKALLDGVMFPVHARVRAGDVLISRANTRMLVGATCRVYSDFGDLYLSDKTLRLVVDEDAVDPEFLVHSLASTPARHQIEDAAGGTSESMKNISQKSILQTEIPYVRGLAEQEAIARQLNVLRSVATSAADLAGASQALRSALLEALFTRSRDVGRTPENEVTLAAR
jgi:restriction endonuclease S subunit